MRVRLWERISRVGAAQMSLKPRSYSSTGTVFSLTGNRKVTVSLPFVSILRDEVTPRPEPRPELRTELARAEPSDQYHGPICDKHPTLRGARRISDEGCVGCHRKT